MLILVFVQENRPSPFTGYGDRSTFTKSPGYVKEIHENQKKKDVFRPTFLDAESGRCDRWRDEERDTNPSARQDRWRDGGKEMDDERKVDRGVDNSSTMHFGEARRAATDRWVDPSKENNNVQRRESKWNSRWGPDDKEVDKWNDVGKQGDIPHEKGLPHVASYGKDERVASHGEDDRKCDQYRPWRPSFLQSRAKAEPPNQQTQLTSKEGPAVGHGRGRRENAATFSFGRGRVNFYSGSNNYSVHGELSPFRYNRTKLLDIYRLTDLKSSNNTLDGLLQVSSLTQEEPLEPLALLAPSPEESVSAYCSFLFFVFSCSWFVILMVCDMVQAILNGIDKGDIVSSGAPQISKDGSSGRSSNDFVQSRRTKHGTNCFIISLVSKNVLLLFHCVVCGTCF